MAALAHDDPLAALIGIDLGTAVVRIERGPVEKFAAAVLDDSPEYRTPQAAADAGSAAIAVPPTFPIAFTFWGPFDELQPRGDGPNLVNHRQLIEPLLDPDGLSLHGEQDFEYHRPLLVGDVLVGSGRVVDCYRKESKGRSMAFIVYETIWRDQQNDELVLTTRRILIRVSP